MSAEPSISQHVQTIAVILNRLENIANNQPSQCEYLKLQNSCFNINKRIITFAVTPAVLSDLHGIFGDVLNGALYILDTCTITLYTSKSHARQLLEINRNRFSKQVYKLFPNVNYCPCESFKTEVLVGRTQYTCKHVLAAKLVTIIGRLKPELISDDQFNFLIQQIHQGETN